MNYCQIEEIQKKLILKKEDSEVVELIKYEVCDFFDDFHDTSDEISRWGHHYFCKEDGGLLIYDKSKPFEHKCSICGTVYNTELLHGVWVCMYRNQGVMNAWKSAFIYKLNGEKKYLDNVIQYATFYSDHYSKFILHNKEGIETKNDDKVPWGSSRIMPQSLNEAIFIIRLVNALELVKEDLDQEFIESLTQNIFRPMFELFKPQINKIHNISCWLNSAIGVMGLFLNQKDMIDFAFLGEFNINNQLEQGVTKDFFWYEGSIHYNFFTLEGIINLLLFSKIYNYEFAIGEKYVEKMLIQGYMYAFDNHQLPNPNDGWPNVNLKSYSYIYAIGTKIYGEDSEVGNLLKNILNGSSERGEFPLSKPFYYKNDISLEEFIFCLGIRELPYQKIKTKSVDFNTSYCGLLKNQNINLFYKYGHNGPSHAHPDKMNIEVVMYEKSLSRDLSNSGYGNALCNEWHRVSASHNTVVVNGENHTSVAGGICMSEMENKVQLLSENVYPNINFKRLLEIQEDGFSDLFEIEAKTKNQYDYFFHVEGDLLTDIQSKPGKLGYDSNGYQHIKEVKQIKVDQNELCLKWSVNGMIITSIIQMNDKELYIAKSPDNPVTNYRTTIILRSNEMCPVFKMDWRIGE